MKQFQAESTVNIFSGHVQLSGEQAKPRAHALKALGEGVYEVTAPICLKAGEKFGFDGEVTKGGEYRAFEEPKPVAEKAAAKPAKK